MWVDRIIKPIAQGLVVADASGNLTFSETPDGLLGPV